MGRRGTSSFGGVPGGAVGVVDGDEVDFAEGAYVRHPDVGVAEAVAVGAAAQVRRFWRCLPVAGRRGDACFGRDAVDGDLDALDGRRGEVVEHEVKTLAGPACLASPAVMACPVP